MSRTWKSRRLLFGGLIALCCCLPACGSLLTYYADWHVNDGHNDMSDPDPESDIFLGEMARDFGLMALFAEVAYRRDLPEANRNGHGCDYVKVTAEGREDDYGMPAGADGRWRRWIPLSPDTRTRACVDESGLYYETYVHEDAAGHADEAVVAFRGTENRKGQYWSDWSSNFVAAFGFEPRQYALAREYVPPLLDALKIELSKEGSTPKIYAVGHSLGGGLAQQAGYLSKDVKEVFTFNTSPVTNWSHLRLAGKIGNAFPIIHRVYHGGEFLEQVRFVATSVTKARYGRHDVGLQLEGRSEFSGHSMKIIACNLAKLIAAQSGSREADHHYPTSYVKEVVLRDKPLDGDTRQLFCAKDSAT